MKKLIPVLLILALFFASQTQAISRINKENSAVQNKIVNFGSNVEVRPRTTVPSALAIGGNVYVGGKVEEDVVAIGGSVYLDKGAVVNKDAVAIGGKVEKHPKSFVGGEIIEISIPGLAALLSGIPKNQSGLQLVWQLISFLSFLGLCVIIVALFTNSIGIISAAIEKKPWQTTAWGLLSFLLMPLFLLLLALSLVGIIFIPVALFMYLAAGIFGYIAAGQLLGKLILKTAKIKNKPMMQEMLLGIIVLCLAGMLPFIGWLVKLIALTIGLGAVAASRFGSCRI
jgi:hypothetical protein